MRLVAGKRVIWMVIALVLSACSTVSNKAPDKLVRHGIQRQFLHDNQFNFNGQIRLLADQDEVKELADKVDDQVLSRKIQTMDSASSSGSVGKKHESKINAKENKESYCAHGNSTEDCDYENRSMNGTLSFFAKKTTVPFSGAIDIPRGKFEFVPEVRYEASNILFSVKVPVQMNLKEKMLITDVRAFKPFANVINAILFRASGSAKFLDKPYFTTDLSNYLDKLPLKELMLAAPKAIDDGYAVYDEKAFVRLPVDGNGKQIGARYRVRLNSSIAQDQVMLAAVLDSLSKQLKQSEEHDTSLNSQADQSKRKSYAVVQKLLAENRKDVLNNKLNKMEHDIVITDFYLNDYGRLMAMHRIGEFNVDDLPIRRILPSKNIITSFWIQFDYTSHPKFTINPVMRNKAYHTNN
jgi:hypothetical protein